ncbi:hypothetical protein HGG70_05255 [Rhodobacteraceae bacterium R_SAG4]|nr:hypothetical protein [Rhodobacteraceae bacterium R_SAG4]
MTTSKIDRENAIAQVSEVLTGKIAARRERDSKLAAGAVKRSDKYLAFFATARFATAVVDYQINLDDLFSRCDKTLDRFVRVFDSLLSGSLALKGETDQNRYTFNLARSLIGAVKEKEFLNKSDVLATATKREDAREFVTVSRRIMSDSTAERQSGIATYVLETLGMVVRTKSESGLVQMTVNKQATAYKRFLKLISVT